jgi:hypothetical protein
MRPAAFKIRSAAPTQREGEREISNTFLQWDAAKPSVHVAEMDREHEQLVGLMNRLYELHS